MSEHDEQVAFVEWCDWKRIRVFAIPNGGLRHKATAGKLKAEGVRAGVPDLMIPIPRGERHGLFIEMKYGRKQPTKEQADWLDYLWSQGYETAVCWSFDEAREVIISYLAMV